MCCPFAQNCPGFEAYARKGEKMHLVWAFCLGEHRDCDRYKEQVADAGEGGRHPDPLGPDAREAILSRLRLSLGDRPVEDR
jgi:hypothetical protein